MFCAPCLHSLPTMGQRSETFSHGTSTSGSRFLQYCLFFRNRSLVQPYYVNSKDLPSQRSRTHCRAENFDKEAYYEQPRHSLPYKWASYLSRRSTFDLAVADATLGALEAYGVDGPDPDFAFVFVSSLYAADFEKLVPAIRERIPSIKHILGSTGYGVIGGSGTATLEVEQQAALSLTLGFLKDVKVKTIHIQAADVPDLDASPAPWQDLIGEPIDTLSNLNFICVADPTFQQVMDVMAGLDFAYPFAAKIGGLSSAALFDSGKRAIFRWSVDDGSCRSDGVYYEGCAIMVMHGEVAMQPIIAQGCRPLSSDTWTINKAVNNIIVEVNSGQFTGTPLSALAKELAGLSEAEKVKVGQNLMLGLAPNDFKELAELGAEDFLIRQIIGMVPSKGAVAVGDAVRVGQRFRFMVRDREGALEDLNSHGLAFKKKELNANLEGEPQPPAVGALMFSCNGRGQSLYGQTNVDSSTLSKFVSVPLSGFMCNGEIGQVGGTTWLHGFTCAVGVIRYLTTQPTQSQWPMATLENPREEEAP